MAATRENVLAAIVEYVEAHKRRAPAKDLAVAVNDTVPNVQAIIKALVAEGAINSSRGRNGGALPDGVVLEKKAKAATVKEVVEAVSQSTEADDDMKAQFAALVQQLEAQDQSMVA